MAAVITEAAYQLGGLDRLVAWVREDEINERLFWSSMFLKLLPVKIQGSGEHGGEIELSVKINGEELQRKLEEHGLPAFVYGVDVPTLEQSGDDVPPVGSNGQYFRG